MRLIASFRVRLIAALVAAAIVVPAAAQGQDASAPAPASNASTSSGVHAFVGDVLHDYWNFVDSMENARIAAGGAALAATVHFYDHKWSEEASNPMTVQPGAVYGNLAFQFPLGITWWVVGHVTGSERAADAGRDLVRAQISGVSWDYLLKYSVNRTRPNGDPRSFPSGHATAAFATATVLEEHYGWKLGLPMYAVAAYVGAERVTQQKHWPSDVVFGAALGIISGRTVTLHVRRERLRIQPHAIPGGGALIVHVQP